MAQYMNKLPRYDIHSVLEKARKTELINMEVKKVEIKNRGVPEKYYIGEQAFRGTFDETITTILLFSVLAHICKRAAYGHGWTLVSGLSL